MKNWKGEKMEEDKGGVYEMQIIDMLQAIQERYNESNPNESEFENGRHEAFEEVIDIIKTRYSILWDILDDND